MAPIWVYPAHADGKPEGTPAGPYSSMAEATDHMLPGAIAVRVVAISGTWLGSRAVWPDQWTPPPRWYVLVAAALNRVLHPAKRAGCRHAELMAEVDRFRELANGNGKAHA